MKHLFLGLLISLFSFTSFAQDYYWVGGSGNWTEFATHWATNSGGTTFHTQAPTSNNSVFFDANSFNTTDQTVTISSTVSCNDMDWSGVTNNPEFKGTNSINIHGSVILSANALYNISRIFLKSNQTGEILNFNGNSFGPLVYFFINGSGEWNLQSDFIMKALYFSKGTLNSNNYDITATTITYLNGSDAKILNMGSSNFTTGFWNVTGSNITLNAGTSTITTDYFTSSDNIPLTYNNLHLLSNNGFSGSFNSNALFNEITIDAGAQIELKSGDTFTANNIIANGSKYSSISIYTSSVGSEATFNVASGTINASYLSLMDVHATGGATFNANQSVDNGNNTGWNITPVAPQDYYWVANGGNWTDAAHWATTSGGSTLHTDYPGQNDDVFFDANSFNIDNQEVIINVPSDCNNMDWTGTTNNPLIKAAYANPVSIYGSAIFNNNITKNIYTLQMVSESAGNTFTFGNDGNINNLKFNGKAGEWTMQDSIACNTFSIKNGTVNLNDKPVYVASDFSVFPSSSNNVTLNMGNSHLYLKNLYVGDHSPSVVSINSGTSTIEMLSNNTAFDGEGFTYHNVIFSSGTVSITSGDNTFANLTLNPGAQLKLLANKTQTITGDLIINGTSANPITISSSIGGTQATFSKASGTVEATYVTIKDNVALGGATFTAQGSTDNGNNTGWNFVKLEQTITINAISNKLTTDTDFDISASSTSGLALSYVIAGPASLSGNTISLDGNEGTVTVTASQSGNSDYNAALDTELSFEVTTPLANQTITFNALTPKTFGDAAFDLTATASSSLAVSYTSSDETVATISGTTVTIVGAGSTTITGSQSGDANTNPAADVEQTLTINKAEQTITLEAIVDKLPAANDFDIVGSSTSDLELSYAISGPATISGTTISLDGNEGMVVITASQAGNTNYNAALDIDVSFLVTSAALADQSITFNTIEDQLLEDGSLTLAATATSGLNIAYEVVSGPGTLLGNIITFTDLGMVTIKAMQPGNDAFNAALAVEQSFEIVTVTGLNLEAANAIELYPNPAVNYIQISGNYDSVKIVNMSGAIVYKTNKNENKIDISHLQSGNYIIMVMSNQVVKSATLIKK